GDEPATVYLIDGTADRPAIENLAGEMTWRIRDALGSVDFAEQHPYSLPHVPAGYGVDVGALTFTGPVVFDRLRVALGEDYTDYPLGGGQIPAEDEIEEDSVDPEIEQKRAVPAAKREKLAKGGKAMPDGEHPMETIGDLASAIKAYGKCPDEEKEAMRKKIISNARRLHATNMLPADWTEKK